MGSTETTDPQRDGGATAAVWDAFALPPTATIHERICRIVAEMPAIGKTQRNEQQQFMYRGHDNVMNELNPLLSRHGVFFAPKVRERTTDQRATRSGGVMYEVNLLVEYTFYGLAGDSLTASAWGEGTDSGDKSTNKAMTMALKNVLAQVFAVSTEELSQDPDGSTPEPTLGRSSAGPAARPAEPPQQRQQRGSAPKTFTDPRAKEFQPAMHLAAGAPRGWEEIQSLVMDLDRTLAEWIGEAVFKLYGSPVNDIEDVELKRQAGRRIANMLSRVRDELFKDGDFPPPTDEQYREVFAWAFDGLEVQGPGTPFDDPEAMAAMEAAAALDHEGDPSEAAAADAEESESAEDVPLAPEPTPEPSSGSQGHVGTSAPDE